jgi:hypothetical protein
MMKQQTKYASKLSLPWTPEQQRTERLTHYFRRLDEVEQWCKNNISQGWFRRPRSSTFFFENKGEALKTKLIFGGRLDNNLTPKKK